jgi:succinoglycan biosynthesis transport protein ExoP
MPDELDDLGTTGWGEYFSVAFRRRWWILLPLFICWIAVWGGSWLLPTTYQSDALIQVEEQKVPDKFVAPNVNLNLQDRVQSITQLILSRTRLKETIDRFGLYSRPHGIMALLKSQDPIDQMRKDVKIDLVDSPGHRGEYSAFRLSYSAGSPKLAQQVNSELTSLFVEENEQTDRQLSVNTTAFLENELAAARARMEEQEAKVAAFKTRHVGELPGQLESNVQILAGLQSQLENTQRTLDTSQQQKIYLESLLQQYQSAQGQPGVGNSGMTAAQTLDKEILDLRMRLEDLRSRYAEGYPDVVALRNKIAKTEALKKQTDGEPVSGQGIDAATNAIVPVAGNGLRSGSPTPMMQIQSQLKANQQEIQDDHQHEKDLESQIIAYQDRLNMTPAAEQELADISRGYEESKSNYDSLLQKQMQSQLATSLEQRQQGEQFRVLDPASLPNKPSAPNHFRISLGGLILGIAVGTALVAFLELTDVRVREEKDLQGIVAARVLVGIPHLTTPEENRLRLVTGWMELGAVLAMAVVIAVGNLYALYKG